MITKENYFEKVNAIDYRSLPEALKEGFDTVKFGSKEYSTWEYLDDDKEFLEIYLKKLNEFLEKQDKKETKKPHSSNKRSIKKAKPKKTTLNKVKKPVKVKKKEKPEPEKVERLHEEIRFIKRYLMLEGNIKTKQQILVFINTLQKAITEKRIRKTSKYAKEIIHIQEQLVKLYNNMPEQVKVEIDKKTSEKYNKIAGSETTMLSVTYIKRYISLHGRKNVKEKARLLFEQIKKAAKVKKLQITDPYKNKLELIYESLNNYIEGKTDVPVIQKAELNGLMGMIKDKDLFSKKKARTKPLKIKCLM